MLPPEIFKKIQLLHFKSKRQVTGAFAGRYNSAFKGQGMEFSEVREYVPGDDPRAIDWNVSARLGHPFVKIYHEERELTVILVIDLSGSNTFGTRKKLKREVIAEVAGMLSFLAIQTNDKVGAILFTSKVEKFVPPQKGVSHAWRLIRDIFTTKGEDTLTNLNEALRFLNKSIKRHAIVFLISDFQDTNFEKMLALTARKHDLTIINISDPAEKIPPDVGFLSVQDPETGEHAIINTSDKYFQGKWQELKRGDEKYLRETVLRAGADLVHLPTDRSVVEPLLGLFEMKGRRQGR